MSVAKTKAGTYAVRWREGGKHCQKSFKTKAEAKRFEATLTLTPEVVASTVTVAQFFAHYRDEVSAKKKGSRSESLRIDAFLRRPWAKLKLSDLSTEVLRGYFSARAMEPTARSGCGTVSPATLLKERTLLSTIFNYAIRRGLLQKNPIKDIERPEEPPHRERVASDKEIELILASAGWDGKFAPATEVQLVAAAFLFACKTGMRGGEIVRLDEAWIEGNVIHIPREATKTDARRDVALSTEALRILNCVRGMGSTPCPFGMLTDATRDVLWRRIRDRAGLGPVYDSAGRLVKEGLNFHDSRATFATWAASPNPKTGAPRLDVLALARQTGHKNLKMLQRYYRASAEAIAKMLDDE